MCDRNATAPLMKGLRDFVLFKQLKIKRGYDGTS